MKFRTDTLIIGAGISGCAAAQELQSEGIDYFLLEKNIVPGGLCRSISIGDAHFDYAGHYLHLARYKSPSQIPYAKQDDKKWQKVERKSAIYIDGNFIPAPFQYNLYALPEPIRSHCINSYRKRSSYDGEQSFKTYLLSGFGKDICEVFLFPYNTKQLAISIDMLSIDSIKRFFPYPDEEKIENGYTGNGKLNTLGYNNYFWYPKNNGIGLLTSGIAKGLTNLQTGCTVTTIDLNRKCVYTSLGEFYFRKLLSSIPLKNFCEITTNMQLNLLAGKLSHNRVLCLNLLLKSSLPKNIKNYHWIYIADRQIPCYRIGVYSNIPTKFTPHNRTSLYVEVAYSHIDNPPLLDSIISNVLSSLEKLGWVHRDDCITISANWIECGYVHFTQNFREVKGEIQSLLKEYNVYLIGRYGQWDYLSMEDSIISGINRAQESKNGH